MRIPCHFLGTPLLPLFLDATTTLPTPLPPRIVLCNPMFLRRVRFRHLLASPKNEDSGRCCDLGIGGLVMDLFLAFDICSTLDEDKV
jgi:hypothetical protein